MNHIEQIKVVIAEMRDYARQTWSHDADDWASRLSAIVKGMEKVEPKLSDSQELNRLLTTKDPSWDAWKRTIPEKYWARYDLSAAKLGWSAAMELVLSAPPELQVPDGMVPVDRVGGGVLHVGMERFPDGTVLYAAAKEEGSAS